MRERKLLRDLGRVNGSRDYRLEIESGGVWVRVPIKTVCLSRDYDGPDNKLAFV